MNLKRLEEWAVGRIAFAAMQRGLTVHLSVVRTNDCDIDGCRSPAFGVVMVGQNRNVAGVDVMAGLGPVPLCRTHAEELMERLQKQPGRIEKGHEDA